MTNLNLSDVRIFLCTTPAEAVSSRWLTLFEILSTFFGQWSLLIGKSW
jgi:hypothetical protein